jgi:hypothetical protein
MESVSVVARFWWCWLGWIKPSENRMKLRRSVMVTLLFEEGVVVVLLEVLGSVVWVAEGWCLQSLDG